MEDRRLFAIGDDFAFERQSLDEKFVANKASTFFFHMNSQAMEPYICQEDTLIVDRSQKEKKNDVILAFYEDQMLCRRLGDDFGHGTLTLVADNPLFKKIRISQGEELKIFGVVIGIARHLR